jgi:hypothetical protein
MVKDGFSRWGQTLMFQIFRSDLIFCRIRRWKYITPNATAIASTLNQAAPPRPFLAQPPGRAFFVHRENRVHTLFADKGVFLVNGIDRSYRDRSLYLVSI